MERVSPHVLRHSAATHMVEAGGGPPDRTGDPGSRYHFDHPDLHEGKSCPSRGGLCPGPPEEQMTTLDIAGAEKALHKERAPISFISWTSSARPKQGISSRHRLRRKLRRCRGSHRRTDRGSRCGGVSQGAAGQCRPGSEQDRMPGLTGSARTAARQYRPLVSRHDPSRCVVSTARARWPATRRMPGSLSHLTRRFFDVLAVPLDSSERAAVEGWLDSGQAWVFFSQSDPDQRHGFHAALVTISGGAGSSRSFEPPCSTMSGRNTPASVISAGSLPRSRSGWGCH